MKKANENLSESKKTEKSASFDLFKLLFPYHLSNELFLLLAQFIYFSK